MGAENSNLHALLRAHTTNYFKRVCKGGATSSSSIAILCIWCAFTPENQFFFFLARGFTSEKGGAHLLVVSIPIKFL